MGVLTPFPIRRLTHVDLAGEEEVGRINGVAVTKARLVTAAGPETWGIIIRGDGRDPYLLVSYTDDNPTDLAWSVQSLACLAFNALHAGWMLGDLLGKDPGLPDGAA